MLYGRSMNNAIAEQFRIALNYLLHREGRGAQVRLALTQNIDRGYLNAVTKGRKPGAEEIRLKIAHHFGMRYEEMLTLGRAVQEETLLQEQGVSQLVPSEDEQSSVDSQNDNLGDAKSVALARVEQVLNSASGYSTLLIEIIDSFYRAVKEKGEEAKIVGRLQGLEERLEKLELLPAKNEK